MPTYNISNSPISKNVKEYINNTNSVLTIKSVVTSNYVQFPAFLTDFSQTFDATWNTEDVFGRMDPIATYQGTKRTMSLGFDVPAGSLEEAKWNLEACSLLTTMVYPVYSDVGGAQVLSKPPLVRVAFANLITSDAVLTIGSLKNTGKAKLQQDLQKLKDATGETTARIDPNTINNKYATIIKDSDSVLGWITGLSWKPNLEMGMFTGDGKLFPKIISISFSFNILHEKVLDQPSLAKTKWPFGD
mgnify:CR=1 FL=1